MNEVLQWLNCNCKGLGVITQFLLGIGAIGTFIMGFNTVRYKDKEIYVRRIREVYAPLYIYLYKQEKARPYLAEKNEQFREIYTRENVAIFSFGGDEKQLFSEDEFVELLKKSDKELMSPNLIKLYSELEVLRYLGDLSENAVNIERINKDRNECEKAIIEEVYQEYIKCIKKLGIDKDYESLLF